MKENKRESYCGQRNQNHKGCSNPLSEIPLPSHEAPVVWCVLQQLEDGKSWHPQSPIELPTSLITARTLIFLTLLITSTVDLKLMVTIFDWFLCSINPDVIDFETWVLTVLQGLGQDLKSWNIGRTKDKNCLQQKQMWRKIVYLKIVVK